MNEYSLNHYCSSAGCGQTRTHSHNGTIRCMSCGREKLKRGGPVLTASRPEHLGRILPPYVNMKYLEIK